ncbi:hypothetical protein FRC02_005487 [Tulasnella sp. 418]|nr:hypothetical protein FRC02_005487 [Tulasnella sp. 418]
MSTKHYMHFHNYAQSKRMEYSMDTESLTIHGEMIWRATITVGASNFHGEGRTKQAAKDAAGKAALLAHGVDPDASQSASRSQDDSEPLRKRWYMHAHNHVRNSGRIIETITESSGPSHAEVWEVKLRVGDDVHYGRGRRRQEAKDEAGKALLVAEGVDLDALSY